MVMERKRVPILNFDGVIDFLDTTFERDEKGLLQGEYIARYMSGGIFIHCFHVNGKRHGEYRDYHEDGRIWEVRNYRHGELHGENYLYRKDGVDATMYYNGEDLGIDPRGMSDMDKLYVMMSGRLPMRGW
jgi:hypothetical protein